MEEQNADKTETWVTHLWCFMFSIKQGVSLLNQIKASKWPHMVPRSSAKISSSIIYDDTEFLLKWPPNGWTPRYQYSTSRQNPNLVFHLAGEIAQLFLKCFLLPKVFSLLFYPWLINVLINICEFLTTIVENKKEVQSRWGHHEAHTSSCLSSPSSCIPESFGFLPVL